MKLKLKIILHESKIQKNLKSFLETSRIENIYILFILRIFPDKV